MDVCVCGWRAVSCFLAELTQVDMKGQYEKDSWAMDDDEQIVAIPRLKEEGNRLFAEKKYEEAAEKYSQALGFLESLILK